MTELTLPPGVERFDKAGAAETTSHNIIVALYGDTKTGKTHFSVRSARPLYIAYLDPNSSLDYQLAKAELDGMEGDVFKCVCPPVPYDELTEAKAMEYVERVESFAKWARAESRKRVLAGGEGGTFVVDGMTMLKGYYEKHLLGESSTLGYRAAKGERGGPSTYDYAKSNGALRDFVSQFMMASCDVILVWEGRPDYAGGEIIPGKFHSTMPGQVPFAITCEVETRIELEKVVENSVQVGVTPKPMIRIGYNSYGLEFRERLIPNRGFASLKKLFLAGLEE